MIDNLKELVQQHLPAMAAGELKKFIEQAENDKAALEQTRCLLKKADDLVAKNSVELSQLKSEATAVANKQRELDEKEKSLNQKDFNLKLEELKYQLQAERESKSSIFQLVQTFISNPRAI